MANIMRLKHFKCSFESGGIRFIGFGMASIFGVTHILLSA